MTAPSASKPPGGTVNSLLWQTGPAGSDRLEFGLRENGTVDRPASGAELVYSSLLGGSSGDIPSGIAVDSSGSAYLTGGTYSSDFPIVNQIPGACNGTCGTGTNFVAFVTKINAAGTALVYSSFLGGSGLDQATSIAADNAGYVYVTGNTDSSDFPIVNQIPGACNGSCGTSIKSVAFVTRILQVGPRAVGTPAR